MAGTLSKVPLEIRQNIYAHLLVTQKGICPFWRTGTTDCVLTKLNLHLSILRTCRTISQECLKFLQGTNKYIHLSGGSLYNYDWRLWVLLNKRFDKRIEMHLLSPATTMPFLRNIRHLELRFGDHFDFANVFHTLHCVQDGICDLRTLGLELLSPWNQSDIKHVLQTLESIRVSHRITISAYQRKDWHGQSIFENMDKALSSWDAIRRYTVNRPEAQPKQDEDLMIELDLHDFGRWVLTVLR